jgi:hypothetical protein
MNKVLNSFKIYHQKICYGIFCKFQRMVTFAISLLKHFPQTLFFWSEELHTINWTNLLILCLIRP